MDQMKGADTCHLWWLVFLSKPKRAREEGKEGKKKHLHIRPLHVGAKHFCVSRTRPRRSTFGRSHSTFCPGSFVRSFIRSPCKWVTMFGWYLKGKGPYYYYCNDPVDNPGQNFRFLPVETPQSYERMHRFLIQNGLHPDAVMPPFVINLVPMAGTVDGLVRSVIHGYNLKQWLNVVVNALIHDGTDPTMLRDSFVMPISLSLR